MHPHPIPSDLKDALRAIPAQYRGVVAFTFHGYPFYERFNQGQPFLFYYSNTSHDPECRCCAEGQCIQRVEIRRGVTITIHDCGHELS